MYYLHFYSYNRVVPFLYAGEVVIKGLRLTILIKSTIIMYVVNLQYIFIIKCDDPAGRHLGRGGPTNPPRKEQCGGRCTPSRRTRPGVQRPKAPTTNEVLLTACRVLAS